MQVCPHMEAHSLGVVVPQFKLARVTAYSDTGPETEQHAVDKNTGTSI